MVGIVLTEPMNVCLPHGKQQKLKTENAQAQAQTTKKPPQQNPESHIFYSRYGSMF